MSKLENAINETTALLQPLFSKPKLSSKLLSKPPFRFIHDILTATIESTGFPEGFFTPQELDSSNFKDDKDAKSAFLEKLINLVNVGRGCALDVSSPKIIAGLDPLNTNILLTAFGRLALDKNLDRGHLVKHCLDGLGVEEYQRLLLREAPQRSMVSFSVADVEGSDITLARQEDFSANGVNSSKPSTEASYKSGMKHVEEYSGDINQTREMIARIVTKPKCSDKLLSKPPFRFLHDVFMAIGKATGFNLRRVFGEEEMDSANIKEKQDKIEFLEKVICFLEAELETSIDVKPSKIIAGLEAERTRYLLQLFVVVATTQESLGEGVTAGKQHENITAPNETTTIGIDEIVKFESDVTEPATVDVMNMNYSDSYTKTHRGFASSDVKQAFVSKIPSRTQDEKIDQDFTGNEILIERLKDSSGEGDKELPMFESLEEYAGEYKEVQGVKSRSSRMRLRLHRTINHGSSTALVLPTKLSLTDLDSIATAVHGITQLTDSLGRYMEVVNSDIEAMAQEKSSWVKE